MDHLSDEQQAAPAATNTDHQGEQDRYRGLSASYDPADNKLRLRSVYRLDSGTYERLKAAGFSWAPRQEVFVAPAWTPLREDILTELAGEIGDEDTTLVDRAAMRAERFEDYSGKRIADANAAHDTFKAITDHIPLGQPILVGHHSERRARKDAERIDNAMRRAVKMWDTADYWKARAKGALLNAAYKELPAVRHRRIKGIEADKRKRERQREEAAEALKFWSTEGLTHEQALHYAGNTRSTLQLPKKEGDRPDFNQQPSAYCGLSNSYPNLYAPRTVAEVVEVAKRVYPRQIAYVDRWIAHFENRIAYERAMLDEAGGTAADKFDIQKGGRVLIRDEWCIVLRVNKTGGKINSVTTNRRYVRVIGIEEIKDYQAATAEDVAKVDAVMKKPPLVNFHGEGFLVMTAADYKRKHSDFKGTRLEKATAEHGAYRYREAFIAADCSRKQIFISDAKIVEPPKKSEAPGPGPIERKFADTTAAPTITTPKEPTDADQMRQQLKAGVQVVAAAQLFPTPAELARRMVELAGFAEGEHALEPSAGSGNILRAIREATAGKVTRTAVEINSRLCDSLRIREAGALVFCRDFLDCKPSDFLPVDVVLMNPPFENASDIVHIRHALAFLKPGGRLIAICANGPRQGEQLGALVNQYGGTWEALPADTFADQGTRVNTALLSLTI